ncbi:hypothetical protein GCM10011610_47950 [Nocardia rhizosphaerihabitans]|uniref:Uncharacterized protein n=1 Tax=Nocardia rhizosphaerihabitans TaxID=1691570 RepID=A0ABQ2KRS4_9NOCA|nr:hypothetical protein GCM10011610_47950 [Nocardia rhizosphaerihabitans]
MVAGHNNQINTESGPVQAEPADCAARHTISPGQHPGAAAQKRPTRRTGWGARALPGYLAGAVKGALMVVKYWIAAPIATGAVMKI